MLPRVALLVALLLAGCASPPPAPVESVEPAVAPPRAMDWSPGNWWSYHALIQGEPLDVALVVSEARPDGYVLGTNATSGFFGLPWSGNLTASRNPVVDGEEWPLFRFPLHDGAEWRYSLLGYEATTVARATDAGGRFALEAAAWGATFARYDYDPKAAWFTRFELIEPTNGTVLLSATLTGYGVDYEGDYFVERTLERVAIQYPALPGAVQVRVPPGAIEVRATLVAASEAGALSATLRNAGGQVVARAEAIGREVTMDQGSTRAQGALSWTLSHAGAGVGEVRLEVTGVFRAT